MIKLRDVFIFLAGAEFFHTLSHALLPLFVKLPLHLKMMSVSFDLTSAFNIWAVMINLFITLLLLAFAKIRSTK
jgi:hypothetical protein